MLCTQADGVPIVSVCMLPVVGSGHSVPTFPVERPVPIHSDSYLAPDMRVFHSILAFANH